MDAKELRDAPKLFFPRNLTEYRFIAYLPLCYSVSSERRYYYYYYLHYMLDWELCFPQKFGTLKEWVGGTLYRRNTYV